MPTKKGGGARGAQHDKENKAGGGRPSSPVNPDLDPAEVLLNMLTKKVRNLEKRKIRLEQLQTQAEEGKTLEQDQCDAVKKLPSVVIQVDTMRELMKQFEQLNADQQKAIKRKQKADEKLQRETERERSRDIAEYTLRIQQVLQQLDDPAKDLLRTGIEGLTLTEAELTQIDEFYELVTPVRAGNARFENELRHASEHMISLYEKSGKEVVNTTYAQLHEVLDKLRMCEYFDREPIVEDDDDDEDEEDDEEDEEEEETQDVAEEVTAQEVLTDYTVVTVAEATKLSDHNADLYQPPPMIAEEPSLVQSQTISPVPITYVDNTGGGVSEDYPPHQSVPSPDFSGLQRPTLSPTVAFTFMREPQVETSNTHVLNTDPQQQQQQQQLSFPSFTSGSAVPLNSTTPTTQSDRLYVPETGQAVVDDKSHVLIGAPSTSTATEKTTTASVTSGNNYHGNGGYNNRGGQNGRGRSHNRGPYQRFNNYKDGSYKEGYKDSGYREGGSRGDGSGYRDGGGYGNRSYGGGMGGQNRQGGGGTRGRGRANYNNYGRQGQGTSNRGNKFKQNV